MKMMAKREGKMSAFSVWTSTIGRKYLVALTGIGLSLFVLTHVSGNFLIFVGPKAYNLYSHALISNPFIYVAEAGLLAMFGAHLLIALGLQFRNWGSRSSSYAQSGSGSKKTSLVTKSLWAQGILIAVFLVFHLITFKFGPIYEATYDGQTVRDLFQLVVEVFQSPAYVVFYIFVLLILGLHLSHGVSSSIQTLGINHPRYTPIIKKISRGYAIFVTLGFIMQPLYIFFFYKG